jgi:uncharacterized protein YbjT (DUF2867 family)
MKLLLVGSTGLVGRNVLALALADARVNSVVAPVRRPLPAHPKLQAPIADFDRLPDIPEWWQVDALVCALGTTMRAAGSKPAFRRVDYEYPLAVARMARQHGTPAYVLNSSMGASTSSRAFYMRVKGELERDLAAVGFTSLTIVRPGLLGGNREEFRIAERILIPVFKFLDPLLPGSWRISPAEVVASALLESAIAAMPGIHFVMSRDLTRTAAKRHT